MGGQDLPEKNLDHDLLKINLGLDLLLRCETDLGHEEINQGPDRQRASPSPDLVQSLLLTHADAKVGQSLNLKVNRAQDLPKMIQARQRLRLKMTMYHPLQMTKRTMRRRMRIWTQMNHQQMRTRIIPVQKLSTAKVILQLNVKRVNLQTSLMISFS